MRYKPGLKLYESSQFKFRNISVYAEPKNETLVFPDFHRDETELMTLKLVAVVEGASRKLSFMDVPMSKHSQASSSGCSQSKATNEVKFVEDVDNIQLENTKEDECHPN
ncbi:hypothetical protein C5167_033361 [Papaver somniferum]|uniref:Uncharacterized protein n=1 Tax=Papaver somniferum TaxID=3469 RepID=A0A4Y7KBE2_PAPSO|nr:hypothetical protein C5167_033361 [Papaver somniferum]